MPWVWVGWEVQMRRAIAIAVIALLALACDREAKRAAAPTADLPSGQGTYVDGEGVRRPLFTTLGVLTYGQSVDGELPPPASLVGYEFFAQAGDAPVIELSDTGGAAALAVYGPRSEDGLWGQVSAVERGAGGLTLSLGALARGGAWFVLVRDEADAPRPYTLTLRCEGCAAPACAPAPCDRVCAGGFQVDGEGCRECACVSAVPCEPECGDDARCVDGECQPLDCADRCPRTVAPVCGADRRTYPNRCVAACAEVQVVADEPCPQACEGPDSCPEGLVCAEGRCVADTCDCDLEPAPVCSGEAESFRNLCLLRCAGAELAHEGPCVARPCRSAEDCRGSAVCVVAPLPDNAARCRADPEAADCIRECRAQRCRDDRECGPGASCVAVSRDFGECAPQCRVGGNACGEGQVCAALEADAAQGVCLSGCDPEGAPCAPPFRCAPDALGQPVCQGAVCPPDDPDCAEANPCDACPAEWAPVCGQDGRLYASACRAECLGRRFEAQARCYRGRGELETACRTDDDCLRTGCEGSVCASQRTDLCASLSPEARCFPGTGACGCVEGQCGWRPSEATEACLARVGGGARRD